MRHDIAQRIQAFTPTVFAEMSALSAQHGAVNLGQGFPDFAGPAFVREAANRAIDAGHNQYAHPAGLPRLRSAIAAAFSSRTGLDIDFDLHVTVTSGATEAIFDTIMALVDPGDEIICFEPFYDSYPASVTMAGGTMRVVRLEPPGWTFRIDSLRAAVTERTRLILLNTPHNPTGKVFAKDELEGVAETAREHDLIVITDEVYDRITFDGARHISIATLPGMWERTLTINSTGKTFSLTGWKIGYAIGPEWLQHALRSVHQFVTFATATPFQHAMADGLEQASENGYYETLLQEYDARRTVLATHLDAAGLPALPVQGSYFLMTPFDHLGFETDVAVCRWLIEDIGVTPIPPSAFYIDPTTAPKLIRFCFAKERATLDEAGRRLAGTLSRAQGR
ncbi:MAG TPA: methionine aminotransferase [Thermomicrobiales bacterium]|nr:methionine aminotransferase [Thermomicrobiales bacterium]